MPVTTRRAAVVIAATIVAGAMAFAPTSGTPGRPVFKGMRGTDAAPAPATGGHPLLEYQGGPVISHAQVTPVVYGSWSYGANSATRNITKDTVTWFFGMMLNSSYVDWLSEYNTPTQIIGRGSVDVWLTITPSATNNGNSISENHVATELLRQLKSGALPLPTPDRVYTLFFRAGQTGTAPFGTSDANWCGLHSSTTYNVPVYFIVMPYEATNTAHCRGGTPLQSLTTIASHEVVESITDPQVNAKEGCVDTVLLEEIGDLCAWQQASLGGMTVQKEWSNNPRGCQT
jgi:hypothetical protein